MTMSEQLDALATLIDPAQVHKSEHVKGAYSTSDYVTWLLNRVFTPARWSFTAVQGPEAVTLSDKSMYVQVVGRLTATFADGTTATRDDVGISPLQASQGGDLGHTAPERYETVVKAAVSDALKACAERLGVCFRPLTDLDLQEHIKRLEYQEASAGRAAVPAKSVTQQAAELWGEEPGAKAPEPKPKPPAEPAATIANGHGDKAALAKEAETFYQGVVNTIPFYAGTDVVKAALKECGFTGFKVERIDEMRQRLELYAAENALPF
jgi:hypothetical protein